MDLHRTTRLVFPFVLSFSLAACGGGGFSGDTGSDSTDTTSDVSNDDDTGNVESKVSTLRLTASSLQLQSSGDHPITLSAIAKDENNVLLEDSDIEFSVDNDAAVTSATGTSIKTSTLTPDIPVNRVLNATAVVGDLTEILQIEVVGTTLSLEGPDNIIVNQPTDYKLLARDSASNAIGYRQVALPQLTGPCNLSSSAGTASLDSAGEYVFTLEGSGKGVCQVSVEDFGAKASIEINVSGVGDEFSITAVGDKANDVQGGDDNVLEIPVNTVGTIQLLYKKDGVEQPYKTVQLSSTRGNIPANVDTDANGAASFGIISSNSGTTFVTASVDGLKVTLDDIEFVAEDPKYISTQASPSIVKPLEKSTITTQILDADNNPVKNKIITFTLSDTVGGSLNASEAKTDSLGRASVEYTAGNITSEAEGVVITSNVQGSETISDTIKLTVGGEALRLVLGTTNKILSSAVTYTKQYVVIVTDSAGNPVEEQEVDVSLIPTAYYKGLLVPGDTAWFATALPLPKTDKEPFLSKKWCKAEDNNDNGFLDSGEDGDNDGFLEPTHDASVTFPSGSNKTGSDGSLNLDVVYPKSRALWSEQKLAVRVSVDGTEYEESDIFTLPVVNDDVNDITIDPPNRLSPYGYYADCGIPD